MQIRLECVIDDKEGNYNKNANPAINFGSYTFDTIMHYNSWSFALEEPELSAAPCNGNWPMERIFGTCPTSICSDEDNNGSREFIDRPNAFSTHDVDVLWGMYARPLAAHEAGDGFATVIAHGDFDDDGREDLAFGIPGEDTSVANAGAVMVFKGTEEGFQPWKLITQSSIGALEEANDNVGSSLAVGDFNDDGIDDLGVADVGRVYIARPNGHVIASVSTMTQGSGDAGTSDHFGSSLAFGNNGVFDILAVGARNEAWGAGAAAGAVFTYNASDSGNPTIGEVLRASPGSDELAEDQFGSSVAVFTQSGRDILIVGNPLEDTGAGNAQVFTAAPVGSNFAQTQLLLQTTKGTHAP